MVRRRLTLRRIDPWSVLKFGAALNVCILAIGLLGFAVLWFFVSQLGLVDKACGVATTVGFQECGINGGNLFRALLLLGLLWVVVQTGLLVFFSFLVNLLSDLTGGLVVTVTDDAVASARPEPRRTARTAHPPMPTSVTTERPDLTPPARPEPPTPIPNPMPPGDPIQTRRSSASDAPTTTRPSGSSATSNGDEDDLFSHRVRPDDDIFGQPRDR